MKPLSQAPSSKRLLQMLLLYGRGPLLMSTVASVGAMLGLLLQTFAFASSIELVVIERASLRQIVPWLLVFATALLIRSGCIYAAGRWGSEGAMTIQQHVRRMMLANMFSSDTYLEQRDLQTAETAQTLLEGVDTLEPYYARYIPSLWLAVLTPLLLLLVIIPTNWLVGLILVLATPAIPFYMALIGMGAESKSREHIQRIRLLSTTFLDYLQGMQTVKALGATGRAGTHIAESAQELGRRSMSVQRIALLSSAVLEFFSTFAIAIIATYIGLSLLKYLPVGPLFPQVNVRTGVFLLLLAPAYFQPLRTLASAYHDRADALAATDHLLPFLTLSEQAAHSGTTEQKRQQVQTLELRDVRLQYPTRTEPVLKGVSLVVRAGERVALIGPSGAGKTSLLTLLTGHARPTGGELYVNGEQWQATKRVQCSWIGQRPYLFPGTIAENIALGQPEKTREAIEDAARKAQVTDITDRLPAGLDAVIGERGIGLSGGEVQRIALARAFLKDAPLLVLDEPTAHLDRETEAQLLGVFTQVMQGKIVLLATHHSPLLTLCNRVLCVEDGVLVEPSVLAKEELYA